MVRGKPARQGNRSRPARGRCPHQWRRSPSARLPRRRMPYAALPRPQDASGPSAIKADPCERLREVIPPTARRKLLKTRAHAGGAR